MNRILGIDYGSSRVRCCRETDPLGITAQGLETISHNNNDKIVLARIAEIIEKYDVNTIVLGIPLNMDGTRGKRVEITEKFMHKLKCKFNKIKIEKIDERLTTVQAHKTMNFLDVNKKNKKNIVDTIAAQYILESYINKISKKD